MVLSARPNSRPNTNKYPSISQGPLDADSTRCTHLAGVWRYILFAFCTSWQWQSFPATESTMGYFAAFLADQVSYSAVKLYMASIHFCHIENNPFQDAPLLHLLLPGIKPSVGLPPNIAFPSLCPSFRNSRLSWHKHLASFHMTNSCYGLPSHWPS